MKKESERLAALAGTLRNWLLENFENIAYDIQVLWPSGQVRLCKSCYTSPNPIDTSKKHSFMNNKGKAKLYADENIVRIAAAQATVLIVFILITRWKFPAFLLAADFALKAFTQYARPESREPVYSFLIAQGFNIIFTLLVAYFLFGQIGSDF